MLDSAWELGGGRARWRQNGGRLLPGLLLVGHECTSCGPPRRGADNLRGHCPFTMRILHVATSNQAVFVSLVGHNPGRQVNTHQRPAPRLKSPPRGAFLFFNHFKKHTPHVCMFSRSKAFIQCNHFPTIVSKWLHSRISRHFFFSCIFLFYPTTLSTSAKSVIPARIFKIASCLMVICPCFIAASFKSASEGDLAISFSISSSIRIIS